MIDDNQRRKVAANLRQYLKKYETPDWRAFCNIILGSGRLDNLRKAQAFDRLADLIDRPTCKIEGTYDDEYGIYDHLTCGHVAMRQWTEPTNYCPNCGAEVVE